MERDDWNARYAAKELVWGAGPNRFLVEETSGLAPGRALDLACGEGRNAIWLAEQGWRAKGVDFSDVALRKAAELAASRGVDVEWEVADVLHYEPEPAGADLVCLFYLQVPASDRATVLPAAAAAVAPGGTFLLVAHDSRNLADGYGGPQSPAVLYTADDVTPYLDGFDVVRAGEALRPLGSPDGQEVVAIDCLVRATRRS